MTIKNFIKNSLEPPKYQLNSKILNKINFQKYRCIKENEKYLKLKSNFKDNDLKLSNEEKNSIDNFGYVIVENFFDDITFEKIVNSFNNYSKSNKIKYTENYFNMIWGSGLISENSDFSEDAKNMITAFKQSRVLNFAKYILKRNDLSNDFELSYQDLKLMKDKNDNLDPNRYIHADRHYHCVKSYFSIEDNNELNSPYIYVPKSHIMDNQRINFENIISKRTDEKIKFRVNKDDLQKLNLKPKKLIIKKNSLVVSDNLGFHARGEMKENSTRKQIRISFHSIQANKAQRLIRKIARKIIK